jgi:hypothetical protein
MILLLPFKQLENANEKKMVVHYHLSYSVMQTQNHFMAISTFLKHQREIKHYQTMSSIQLDLAKKRHFVQSKNSLSLLLRKTANELYIHMLLSICICMDFDEEHDSYDNMLLKMLLAVYTVIFKVKACQ